MLKKKILMLALSGVLVFSLAACGDASSESDESSSASEETTTNENTEETKDSEDTDTGELKTVRIGLAGETTNLSDAAGVALQKGFIEEELEKVGYTADVIGFAQAGPAVNEAFTADELDIAIYGDMPAVTLKAAGKDTTVFAVIDDERQMAVFATKDSGIESVEDLVGKKVIVGIGTVHQNYFKTLLNEAGIDEADVEAINSVTDAASLLSTGEADAYIAFSSTAYYYEEEGLGQVVLTTQDRPDLAAQFFAVGETTYLQENPEAAKALVKALERGRQYMLENTEECYEMLGEATELGSSAMQKAYAHDETFSSMYPTLDEDNVTRLKSVIDFMTKEEFITAEVDAESFVDPSYADEAMAEFKAEQ